jgi:hypothetical protein
LSQEEYEIKKLFGFLHWSYVKNAKAMETLNRGEPMNQEISIKPWETASGIVMFPSMIECSKLTARKGHSLVRLESTWMAASPPFSPFFWASLTQLKVNVWR